MLSGGISGWLYNRRTECDPAYVKASAKNPAGDFELSGLQVVMQMMESLCLII